MKRQTICAILMSLTAGIGFAQPKYQARAITWRGYHSIRFSYLSADGKSGAGTAQENSNLAPYLVPQVCFSYENGVFTVLPTPGFSCQAGLGNSKGDFIGQFVELSELAVSNSSIPSVQYFHYRKATGTFDPIPSLPNYTTVINPQTGVPYSAAQFIAFTNSGEIIGYYGAPDAAAPGNETLIAFRILPDGTYTEVQGTAKGDWVMLNYMDGEGNLYGSSVAQNASGLADMLEWPASGGAIIDLNVTLKLPAPTLQYYYFSAHGHLLEVVGNWPNTDNLCIFSNGKEKIDIPLPTTGPGHQNCGGGQLANDDEVIGTWIPNNSTFSYTFYWNPTLSKSVPITSLIEGVPEGTTILSAVFVNLTTGGPLWGIGYPNGNPLASPSETTLYLLTPVESANAKK